MIRKFHIVPENPDLVEIQIEEENKLSAQIAGDKLIKERRKAIHNAYMMLPEPKGFPDGYRFKIPYICGKFTDFYVFIYKNGRWVMENTEFNRHLYRGVYI